MKFDVIARFLKTISMAESILSSEIKKIYGFFFIEIIILLFLRKFKFSRVLQFVIDLMEFRECLNRRILNTL